MDKRLKEKNEGKEYCYEFKFPGHIMHIASCRNRMLITNDMCNNTVFAKILSKNHNLDYMHIYASKYVKFIPINNDINDYDIIISNFNSETEVETYISQEKYQPTIDTIVLCCKKNTNVNIILYLLQYKIAFTEDNVNMIICHLRFSENADKIMYTIQKSGYDFTKLNYMYLFNCAYYPKIFSLIELKNFTVDDDMLHEILKAKMVYGKLSLIINKIITDSNKNDENIVILFCLTMRIVTIKRFLKNVILSDRMKKIITQYTKLESLKKLMEK
jgi:hypothetical protein